MMTMSGGMTADCRCCQQPVLSLSESLHTVSCTTLQYNFTSTLFDIYKLIEDAGQLSCVAFAWHLTRMQKTTLTATLLASGINV